MILPGTLVQYQGAGQAERMGLLRRGGIYTVAMHHAPTHPYSCGVCRAKGKTCDAGGIELSEVPAPKGITSDDGFGVAIGQYALCAFRIIAPPITEADRLEASAPVSDAPAKPKRVRV